MDPAEPAELVIYNLDDFHILWRRHLSPIITLILLRSYGGGTGGTIISLSHSSKITLFL
jgi:hypothetical protein